MINDLNNIKVRYESIALPPFSININLTYTVVVDKENIFIQYGNFKMPITEKMLRIYFKPIDNDIGEKTTSTKDKLEHENIVKSKKVKVDDEERKLEKEIIK